MNGYNEKSHYDDEPEPGSFVRAFDAFRKCDILLYSSSTIIFLPAVVLFEGVRSSRKGFPKLTDAIF